MKLQAEIGDEKLEIEITREDGKVLAQIDDRKYELEASEPEPNVFLLKNGGKIFQVYVSPQQNTNGHTNVTVSTNEFEVKLIDPKRLRGSGANHEQGDGAAEIKTAMPGKVVRILVTVGDTVAKGDGVIVVEAMKMQNEMKSPKDGTISDIKVAEGDTVSAGDVLVVIE
jgi:biotin carboxyl carrier protein